MRQLWGMMALTWGGLGKTPLRLYSSTLLLPTPSCSTLVQQDVFGVLSSVFLFWCFGSRQGNAIFSLWWKGKVYFWSHRGADLYKEKCYSGPWLAHPHANEDTNFCCLIGTKGTVLTGQNGATLIGQWRCQWGYSCKALTGPGKSQSNWLR